MKTIKDMKVEKFIGIGILAVGLSMGVGLKVYDTYQRLHNTEIAKEMIEAKGYTDVELTGHNMLCVRNPPVAFKFTAKNLDKKEVEGRICAGRAVLSDSITTSPKNN